MKNKELIKESKKGNKSGTTNETENADDGKNKKESSKDGKEQRDAKSLRAKFQLRKEKNPEIKFEGDGINFKAKLIGIEKVDDARGDKMCQESLQRLKAAVKSAGEHKQKILLGISLEGVKIKDEKSGELMYHHQVHKISFISQDIGDARAFGYVFGAPHSGHQFFAIKTEKSASNVVIALRDLFQTVLQMKKQEMEKVKQQQDNLSSQTDEKQQIMRSNTCETSMNDENNIQEEPVYTDILSLSEEYSSDQTKIPHSSLSSDSREMNTVDSMLDFQFEVDCLQQGIAQMDNSIAKAAAINSSFDLELPFPPLSTPFVSTQASCQKDISTSELAVGASPSQSIASISDSRDSNMDDDLPASTIYEVDEPKSRNVEDRYAVFSDLDSLPSIFENPYIVEMPVADTNRAENDLLQDNSSESEVTIGDPPSRPPSRSPNLFDTSIFADLDPLGKNRPYVDKKDFFQELKKPPKKVLKDLAGEGIEDNLFDHDLLQSPHSSVSDLSVGVASVYSANGSNPFRSEIECPSPSPPKLPPKEPLAADNVDNQAAYEKIPWEVSNSPSRSPFNPFISPSVDIPPPTIPPPSIPARGSEPLFQTVPSPPPRPPSRNCTTPTPPLPKRKLPQSQYGQVVKSYEDTWNGRENYATNGDIFAPPIPIPARKPPLPYRCGSPLLGNNSPATMRRQLLRSSASIDTESPITFSHHSRNHGFNDMHSEYPLNNSQKVIYSKNLSPLCSLSSCPSKAKNPFETSKISDSVNGAFSSQLPSPPLPARPPKSPQSAATSVQSSDSTIVDKRKPSEKKAESAQKENEISIFQRKHDPFDDDFFTSLPRKSSQKEHCEITKSIAKMDANGTKG